MSASPVSTEAVLSVVVPVYNAADHLIECVDSILRQSFRCLEVLLVDDGSTDASASICERYARRDSRVRVFHRRNGGPSAARNCGISAAVGRYVQFVDSDDVLADDACMMMVRAMDETATDLVVSGASIVQNDVRGVAHIVTPPSGTYCPSDLLKSMNPATKAALLHYVWNKCYRMAVIRAAGLEFDEDVSLGEDFLFNCRYWKGCGSVTVVAKPLYMYHLRDGVSLTGRFHRDELGRRRMMDQALVDLFSHYRLLEQERGRLNELMGSMALTSLSKVTLPDCRLPKAQKAAYLADFAQSEYRDHMRAYRESGSASIWERVRCRLAERGAVWILLLWLWGGRKLRGARLRLRG